MRLFVWSPVCSKANTQYANSVGYNSTGLFNMRVGKQMNQSGFSSFDQQRIKAWRSFSKRKFDKLLVLHQEIRGLLSMGRSLLL